MANLNKDIDIITLFKKSGEIEPIRFRIEDETGEQTIVKIERFQVKEKSKIKIVFTCLCCMNGFKRLCEIWYWTDTYKWTLYSIK